MLTSLVFMFCSLPLATATLTDTSIDEINEILPAFFQDFPDDCLGRRIGTVKKFCPGDKFKRKERKDLDLSGDPPKKKRNAKDDGTAFWHCDFPILRCCKTCRRRIPKLKPIVIRKKKVKTTVYPVYCPKKGGFQLRDQIGCVQQNCAVKCKKEYTFVSFMVTDEDAEDWNGFCERTDMNVWFIRVKMNSHCICPRERGR